MAITGINTATAISIANGEYAIDGGAFTTAPATINNDQTLTIRTIASDKTNTPIDVTVTVGGVSATFTVTTLADVTPDTFSFTAKTDVAVNTEETSEPVTIKGIDIAVPVSITGGLYSINGGEFTASAGTVSADQTIVVKTTSGESTEITSDAVLTIGGVTGAFTVTTPLDTAAPVAEFKFPTPYTMSEANEVKVRGVAADDHAITEVKLVVRSFNIDTPESTLSTTEIIATPKSEIDGVKDFSNWTASIPLTADAENEIKVVAVDDRDNETVIDQANKVVIRHRVDYSGVFPDSGSPLGNASSSLLLDKQRHRLIYQTNKTALYAIDIATAASQILVNFEPQIAASYGMGVVDKNNEYAYLPALSDESIIKLDLQNPDNFNVFTNSVYAGYHGAMILDNSGEVPQLVSARNGDAEGTGGLVITRLDNWEAVVFSAASLSIPDSSIPFDTTSSMAFDQKNNRYLVSGPSYDSVISIDATTAVRSVFSSESVGSGDAYGAGSDGRISTIALDEPGNRLIVLEIFTGNIFAVDLDTAERSIISQMTLLHPTSDVWPNDEKNYIGSEIDTENELLYTIHHRLRALMVVDLQSGQQLILSKVSN